jgi:DUF4097 and DUF4098 domain-containing protein YvlB
MKVFGLFTLVAASLFAQDTTLTQEGGSWVRTISGVPAISSRAGLVVSSFGRVVVTGTSDNRASFRIVQRVRAGSEREARQLLGDEGVLTIQVLGPFTQVVVNPRSAPNVSTELQLMVPRQLPIVRIGTRGGAIEAFDMDGAIDVSTGYGPIHVDRIAGSVTSRTGGGEIRIGKIGGALQSISGGGNIYVESIGGGANCETAGGEIVVKQAGGRLVLSTVGGNISVDRAGGSVDAHSGEGVIEILQAGGLVTAATRSGSIEVGSARGVNAESAMGQVRVKGSSGPLRVSTAAGSILAELLSGISMTDSSLVAGAGDVTVLIPSNLALSVLASNQSGGNRRIVSDFSEVRVKGTGFFQAPLLAEGSINGGGPMLNINAAGGVIYLRKK